MSQENVEIVREVFDAEARRDFTTLHAFYAPEIEMDLSGSPFADFAGRETLHGLGEVRHAFRDFYAAFADVESELGELIDAGDHVVSVFTYRGRGRTSGVVVEWKDMAGLWTFRGGKISRVTWLRTRDEALEAAGLSE
jgi:ketosteroid isomerase-like protein